MSKYQSARRFMEHNLCRDTNLDQLFPLCPFCSVLCIFGFQPFGTLLTPQAAPCTNKSSCHECIAPVMVALRTEVNKSKQSLLHKLHRTPQNGMSALQEDALILLVLLDFSSTGRTQF